MEIARKSLPNPFEQNLWCKFLARFSIYMHADGKQDCSFKHSCPVCIGNPNEDPAKLWIVPPSLQE
jgi:hypothetical protein